MRVGAAQIEIKFKDKSANFDKCEYFLSQAKENSVEVLVFPECTLTGYIYGSFDEAFAEAETIPGKLTDKLLSLCRQYKVTVLFGFLEKEDGLLYNTALLMAPEGIVGKYRKTHLLHLGVDRFCTPGNSYEMYNLPKAKVAPLICYELRSPESCRVATLNGAQIILTPANLALTAEAYSSFINQTRACENRVFLVSANRTGIERGLEFIGKSQIINTAGEILVEASRDKEELIYADIVPEIADIKKIVVIPGEYEFDIFGDRKPQMYDIITE